MGKYKSTVSFSVPFDEETAHITVTRASFADALLVADQQQSSAVVCKYVTSFDGITDADGNKVDLETVFREHYFAPLALEITKQVLATGKIPKEQEHPFGER